MKKKLIIMLMITLINIMGTITIFGQSTATTCANASPFCTGTTYTFPMSTGTDAETGPNYGCLYTYPNSVWYYLKILNPGNITIHIAGASSSDTLDVDFACWGPFTSATSECDAGLTASCSWAGGFSLNPCPDNTTSPSFYPSGNMVDCSYSADATENCHILNALAGQYYMLCITNYSDDAGNLTFSQTGGTGTTDCSIIAPPITNNGPLCIGQTLQLTVTNPTTGATYKWTGPNGFTSALMNPSITNVTAANAGVYSLVITVGGNSSTPVTTTVIINPNPTVGVTASANPICAGTSTTLTGSGASTYSWSSGLGTGNPVFTSPASATTYTVTGTDANGCSNTASILININPNLTVGISASANPICSGGATTLTANGGTTYSWSGSLGTTNSITVLPTSNTTYSVTGTSAGCTGTASITVTVNSNPTVSIYVLGNPICAGTSTTLSASGGTAYSWNGGFGTANPITDTPTSNTTYTVTGTDANGCTNSASILVTVNPLPTITVSASANPICPHSSTILTASGGSSYAWNTSQSGSPITVTPGSTTTYTVTGTLNGCDNTADITINILNPAPVDAGPNVAICIGDSTQLNASGGLAYIWTPSTGLSSTTISNPVAKPSVTTKYFVSSAEPVGNMIINGDFTSGNSGFTSQYGYQINLGPEGYYYVGTNPNICNSGYSSCPDHTTGSGNMMIVNGAGTPGIDVWCETIPVTTNSDYNFSTWATSMNTGTPAILQFSINGQAMGSAFTLSTTPCAWSQFFSTWNSGANSTANICIVNQNTSLGGNDFALDDIAFSPLCSSTDSVVVTINLPPNAQVSPFTPATCGLNNGSATATGGSIYLWSNAATTATATGLAPGSYTVTVTNISGCSATASVTINNTPVPTVTSTSTNENCNQSNGTSTAVVTNGALPVKYSWSDAKTTQTITNLTAGVYTVTITDANGCTCFTTDTVTNLPGPSVSIISATNTTCGSANGGAVANAALGNSPYTYKWSNAQTGANLISVIAGTYTVTVTDANNCKATNSVTLTNTPGPTASITATIASDCGMSDGSAILNVTGGTQPYTFNWNSTPSEISQNLINVPKGDYIGIVTDSNGCTFTVSAAIAQNPGPTVTASSTSEICGKGNGTVTALAAGGMGHYTYLWSTNATDAVVSGLATGTYTVSISDGGCSASTSIFVGEIPGPVAGFIIHPKLVSVLDNQVYFADNSTGSVIIWDWSLGDNYYEYVSNFSHNYINVGSYPVTLIVTDTNGCKDEITDTVKVKDVFTFYIPNAFSPNDDEINDGFTPQGTNVDPAHFEMYIFDRWGNLMFHTTKWYVNSAEPWNGTLNNSGTFNDAVMDTYVYKIVLKEIEGPNHEYVGKITIVE